VRAVQGHLDDPDHDMVRVASVEHRRVWIGGYRGTMGSVALVLNSS